MLLNIFCRNMQTPNFSSKRFFLNKKVLLRERKRHTACRVASTPYVVLTGYPPSQGTPPARVPPGQGTPLGQGTPPARVLPRPGYPPGQGTPPARVPPRPRYPPGWTWQGTPQAGPGRVPPRLDLAGYPPGCPMAFWEMLQSIMGYGYPPCGQTEGQTRVKTLPSLVLRTRAVKIKDKCRICGFIGTNVFHFWWRLYWVSNQGG